MMTGWVMFGILFFVNSAIYIGIGIGFDNNFWREDEQDRK